MNSQASTIRRGGTVFGLPVNVLDLLQTVPDQTMPRSILSQIVLLMAGDIARGNPRQRAGADEYMNNGISPAVPVTTDTSRSGLSTLVLTVSTADRATLAIAGL
jgi:hypothetical protein